MFHASKVSAFSDLTHIEYPCIRYAASRESFFEQLRRLEHIFLCQDPLAHFGVSIPFEDENLNEKMCLGSTLDSKRSDLLLQNVSQLRKQSQTGKDNPEKCLTVPQCIPIARSHFVSLKMLTLSKGFACIGDIIQRGS